jgi:uncharacterized protein (DUF58 family)
MISKKITTPQFRDYYRYKLEFSDFTKNIGYHTQLFNNFNFFSILTILCAIMGYYNRLYWAVGLTNIALLFYLYYKTKNICLGITLKRTHAETGRERQNFEILYQICNQTSFPLVQLQFHQKFDGIQACQYTFGPPKTLAPHSCIKIMKRMILDGGMGIKTLSPTTIEITDELGIFHFKIEFDNEKEIEVAPYIEEISNFKTSVSPDSIEYGFYDIAKRGDSNLFIGTREYRHGDPVKHINWKLTKKSQTVVINEFEKNTNSFVTLMIDLDNQNQLGIGAYSSWELAKDLALSITINEINKNNHLQILSSNLYIPFSTGKKQLALIEKHLTLHEISSEKSVKYEHLLANLPRKSQIYYICPKIATDEIKKNIELAKKLQLMGHNVVIFVTDPYQELIKLADKDLKSTLRLIQTQVQDFFHEKEMEFKEINLPFFDIQANPQQGLKEQLFQSANRIHEKK